VLDGVRFAQAEDGERGPGDEQETSGTTHTV
jgi:hypothetical protein